MKKLLKEFKKTMNELFDDNMNSLSNIMKEVNFDDIDKQFKKVSETIQAEFGKLASKVKNSMELFKVEIPFDVNKSTISVNATSNKFKVKTETIGKTHKTEITEIDLPSDVDVNTLTQKYDEKHKVMRFFFKKKGFKDEVIEVEEEVLPTEEETVTIEEEVPQEVKETTEKEELIKKMVQMHDNGISYKKIAEEVGISERTVRRWIKAASLD